MRKQLLSAVLTLVYCGSVWAQTDKDTSKGRQWWVEPTFLASIIQGGNASQTIGINLGWDFTQRFMAFAHIESGQVLQKDGDLKTWFPNSNAGLGVGYVVAKDEREALALRVLVARGLEKDWEYNMLDAALFFQPLRRHGITIGLGYRYYHSCTDGMGNAHSAYASFGFKF